MTLLRCVFPSLEFWMAVENKDKLILDAVNRIYTTPVPQSNTSAASVAKPEDTKSILEGLKTLKDTVTEVVKSTK